MKKLVLSLFSMMLLVGVSFANEATIYNGDKEKNGKPRVIRIKFHGGTLCWLPGSACEGEIYIEYKTTLPKDVKAVKIPEGYHLITMSTPLFEKANISFESRTFNEKETNDGSKLYIPAQASQYSNALKAFVVYGKTL